MTFYHAPTPPGCDEMEAIKTNSKLQAAKMPDDLLEEDLKEVRWLLTLNENDELGGDRDQTRTYLEAQRDAIIREQDLRRRYKRRPSRSRRLISQDLLDTIKRRLSIVDLLQRSGVNLRRSGRSWRTACPFCQSSNPTSFTLWDDGPKGPGWRCWVCHTSGDVFMAIQLLARCTFPEAVSAAATLVGIELAPQDVRRGAAWREEVIL